MEKTYSFEIHLPEGEFETLMGAETMVDAIIKLIDVYKYSFGMIVSAENFFIIGEL